MDDRGHRLIVDGFKGCPVKGGPPSTRRGYNSGHPHERRPPGYCTDTEHPKTCGGSDDAN